MTQHIGPYEIRGEFGRGAMAVVWEAWDPSLERVVAVKEPVVSAALPEDEREQFSQRFVREAKSAARLNHPGIVTIYSADVFEGRPAIVMEAIQGSTLADLMERGDLSTGAAVSILDQLLDAAGYAHSQGIVHRDIKPDNIFVTEDGRVKLADFGIAHVDSDAKMTQAGTMMGTPGYMAPEQVTGSPVDGRTDIFAVGVIGYEMLMGENPFGADAGTASTTVMYRIVHDDVPFLAPAIVTATPPFVADAIRIAMAKDPAARFASAEQMRAYLRGGPSAVAAGAYVPAAQAAVAGQAAHSGGPNKGVLIGAGIVVAAAMLLGVMFLGPGSGGAGTGGSLAPPPPPEPVTTPGGGGTTPPSSTTGPMSDLSSAADLTSSSQDFDSEGVNTYDPANLIDGNYGTCWAEGAQGYGVGEWVRFDWGGEVTIGEWQVVPGYQKKEGWDRWVANGRLKKVELQFSSGDTRTFNIRDVKGLHHYAIKPAVKASWVRVVIKDAYHGKYQDTSVSEMGFSGWQ